MPAERCEDPEGLTWSPGPRGVSGETDAFNRPGQSSQTCGGFITRKKLIGGTLLTGALIGSLSVAPASANVTRIANCSGIGGDYVVGNNASNDRCVVTTISTGQPWPPES